ncbi:hypothetical protein Droror1_Dr00013814 [Drosera rotundifolia]
MGFQQTKLTKTSKKFAASLAHLRLSIRSQLTKFTNFKSNFNRVNQQETNYGKMSDSKQISMMRVRGISGGIRDEPEHEPQERISEMNLVKNLESKFVHEPEHNLRSD